MIRQSELKKYLELKDRFKKLEKSLKERLGSGEKAEAGHLVISKDTTTSYNPTWKDVTLDAARTFQIGGDRFDDALRIMNVSFDKFSQPHQTQPTMRVENKPQRKARNEKSDEIDLTKSSKKLKDYL